MINNRGGEDCLGGPVHFPFVGGELVGRSFEWHAKKGMGAVSATQEMSWRRFLNVLGVRTG